MKPFNNLITLIVISCLVLSPCLCYLTLGRNRTNNIQCIDSERDALLQFKHGVRSDVCGLTDQWRSHTDCCRWPGVVCSNLTNHVVKLSLGGSDYGDSCWSIGTVSHSLDCWMNFSQLGSLHLENNRFSGSMPKSISTLSRLQFLHLYNNSFSGRFPVAFANLTSLVILNLGYNSFSGNIPYWIGNAFQSLGALILRENHFTGEIPESICQLNSSQILDLASNHLSGVLPHCIDNFTVMKGIKNLQLEFELDGLRFWSPYYVTENRIETVIVFWKREEQRFKETIRYVKYIDLSSNELTGEIPDGISSLTALGSLDLSKNNLSGYIPLEIGNLTALEVLDLSNNHLSGEIPISLAKLTTLDVMNVSNNNLSGEIPVSTQLQSFDASSYAGNPRLCGAPLPSCLKDRAPSNVPNGDNTSVQNKDDDFVFLLGLYISVVLGFIVGFWAVCGTLVIKTSWRRAYFRLLDNIKDKIL